MPVRRSDPPHIETREEVMFYDTDLGGVVHNIAYLRFIEKARTKLGEALGLRLRAMAETGVFPVVVRTEIDYRAPARLGDSLAVRGWLAETARVRFGVAFEIVDAEADGRLLVTARQTLALVKMPEGKLLRLPEGFRIGTTP